MAYFGKEFTFEKEENYEDFIASIGVKDEEAKQLMGFKPNQKIDKDGDSYTITFVLPTGEKSTTFKDGETIDDEVREGFAAKSTFTVDGDTVTQVQDFGEKGQITLKREYSESGLKVTVTASVWDGAAYRWYTPV